MTTSPRNTAARLLLTDKIAVSDQTDSSVALTRFTVKDRDTLPDFLHNAVSVGDSRFELRDGGVYLKAGVHLAPGKYSVALTVADEHNPALTTTTNFNFRVGHDRNDHTLHFTGAIDESGTQPDGTMWFGSGNPSTGYTIAEHVLAGVEFGWNVHYRTGDQIAGHVESDGLVHFDAPAGHQTGYDHNVQGDKLNRSAVSLDYALVTGLDGKSGDVGSFVTKVYLDLDPTAAIDFKAFTIQHSSAGVDYLVADDGSGGMGDEDGTNPNLCENSINFGFAFLTNSLTANTGDFQAGTYDMVAEVYDITGQVLLVGNHIVLDVA